MKFGKPIGNTTIQLASWLPSSMIVTQENFSQTKLERSRKAISFLKGKLQRARARK
ncbi:hypothetical protein G3R49_19660 [Shewanella sp. WXL01]|uniref:hypothetical protein n=1 Tax=Shewanella sp. WXL01 TaxID=2709721 RepID=UPI0014383008|nr:hypothetical protein [Shewanella sp. WXL01]NKF52777.1 hypothetical protein [Shewanella sp. WXL01]